MSGFHQTATNEHIPITRSTGRRGHSPSAAKNNPLARQYLLCGRDDVTEMQVPSAAIQLDDESVDITIEYQPWQAVVLPMYPPPCSRQWVIDKPVATIQRTVSRLTHTRGSTASATECSILTRIGDSGSQRPTPTRVGRRIRRQHFPLEDRWGQQMRSSHRIATDHRPHRTKAQR